VEEETENKTAKIRAKKRTKIVRKVRMKVEINL
jgi:hypothetical protein